MRFRTEIEVKPFDRKIGYGSRILSVGSCFADNMAGALQRAKFHVTANPAGALFNPASIARTLQIFHEQRIVTRQELAESDGRWFDYRFHGSLSASAADEALSKISHAIECGHKALSEADTVIITFGTAWIYELNSTGETVANCHKQPANLFRRRRLSVEEIVGQFMALAETILRDKTVILTVSPVRHLGDGADENFLSKATLKLAVAELAAKLDNVLYFPAYEILNDDLRDYRFYADDLVHPSAQAVEYIREKFFGAVLDTKSHAVLQRVEKICAAAAHRPEDPHSSGYTDFCRKQIAAIEALESETEGLDLSTERECFARFAH